MYYKIFLSICFIFFSIVHADEVTLETLQKLQQSELMLKKEIELNRQNLKAVTSEDEKEKLNQEIKNLNEQLNDIATKFEKIATGIDTSTIKADKEKVNTTLSEDLQLLIKPLISSAKEATGEMRQKAQLQEEIEHYKEMLPNAVQAHDNIEKLINLTDNKELQEELKPLKKYWEDQVKLLSSNLNASQHQVDLLEKNSVSFGSSLKQNTKSFFQERGLYLFEGFLAFILVITLMNLIHHFVVKWFPIFTKPDRSFYLRLLDLFYRLLTVTLAIVIPMAIFYFEEDWFLFSIGLLLLFGLAWTFRNLVSEFWQQTQLFLNIGSVREHERIFYEGLPWRVKNINIFTVLENPTLEIVRRIPIESLIGMTSRPTYTHEPWFPCKIEEWVVLSDGYYGKVIGVSLEFIKLEDLGGGHKTYMLSDFLNLSPLNLSSDFRVVETFGIAYRHQKASTTTIVQQLEVFILQKIEKEAYAYGVKKVLVQFANAGDSSLNFAVIIDFNGEMAPLYNRLRRAIQRWCVDASNQYGWEIPFPQLTIHQADR